MKDIFWTIYLAVTILISICVIYNFIRYTKESSISEKFKRTIAVNILQVSILWAIWYMYFLH